MWKMGTIQFVPGPEEALPNLDITSSRLKLAGFFRIGYSLKLLSH
jgi:hypothetical protein